MRQSVRERYEALTQSGAIVPDDNQRRLAEALDALLAALNSRARGSKRNALARLFTRSATATPPRGLFVYGDVGGGKTLLLDLFHQAASKIPNRRVHFHAFMADVHERIDRFRRGLKAGGTGRSDPIAAVAAGIASEIELLCFDEFVVNDIADAMILGRLFAELFARGVVVVATSNKPPEALYKDGLNRSLFLPFIDMLKEHMALFHLAAPRDYRLDATGTERRYVFPLGREATACLDAHFRHLTGMEKSAPKEIANKGRRIVVPEAAAGVARFSFGDLCARALGAGDFRKIADAFHTIVLADVPVLDAPRRNEAKRLIALVDILYDRKVRLIVSAEAEPPDLWTGTTGPETAEFARTASRLVEMRSDAYWERASRGGVKTKKARAT